MAQAIEPDIELPLERSLDPENWDTIRALGHRIVDESLDYLKDVRSRPVWRPIPLDVKRTFHTGVPVEGIGADAAYEEFRERVLPFPTGNIHPRFWGWVLGSGTPFGALSDLLAATMNCNCWGNETAAADVEGQVIEWFKTIFGFPAEASGLLVTGASVANMLGLAVARNAKSGFDIFGSGLTGLDERPVLYCSTETHNSVEKAVMLLGLGAGSLRQIATDANYQLDLQALEQAIQTDRAAGHKPFAVVANVGTVNTGAIDDVGAIADVARAHDLWLHVDGAFGALVALAPQHRDKVAAIARADSLAFDFHKWLHVPFDAGCVLVRDRAIHAQAFAPAAGYLAHEARGPGSGEHWFNELGMELSRGFRALKVWMSLKEHGIRRYGEQIDQNISQARYLARLVEDTAGLELCAPAPLNIVCFRVKPRLTDRAEANALNREVLLRLQERGIAVPSATMLSGRYVIRVSITNHRTERRDLHTLIEAVLAIADEVRTEEGP